MSSNKKAIEDKKTYVESHPGLPPFDDAPSTLRLDKHASAVAGAAFDALKHDPNDPEVRAAYDALKREVKAQYDHVVSRGLRILPWTKGGQPYENSKDLREKVGRTHEIYYFPTRAGFGSGQDSSDHPLNAQVPGMPEGTVYNDLFRAVHDYFGHVMHPHEFGPQGELRAWHEHARMFTPEARKALTTETHGQNSWVNFGPHGPQKLPVTERPYAEQKAAVLPAEHHPVKLARRTIDPPSELERHAVAAMQNRKDPMALHVFADHVEEHHPNSVWVPVIREMQAGGNWRAKAREAAKIHTAEKRLVPRSTMATGSASVGGVYFHPELNEWRVGSGEKIVAPSHWWDENEAVNPIGVVDGKKTTMDRALHLLRNMPGGVDNVIGMALVAHFFAENREMRAENADRLKLARRTTATKKHPEYWAFLNQLADNADPTTAKVFADWLSDRGDPREHVARAVVGRFWFDESGKPYPHPERSAGSSDRSVEIVPGDHPGRSLMAFSDTANTGVSLRRVLDQDGQNPLPVLRWTFHIPRTVSNTKTTKGGMMTAPVTVEQLHQFIDAMPHGATKALWKDAARQHGWERPVKLARGDFPLGTEGNALFHAVAKQSDPASRAALADWMQENGVPGAHIVGASAKGRPNANEQHLRRYFGGAYWSGQHGPASVHASVRSARAPAGFAHAPVMLSVHHSYDAADPRLLLGTYPVWHHAAVWSREHLEQLLADFPQHIREEAQRVLGPRLPQSDRRSTVKLARLGPAVTGRTHTGETRYTHEFTDDEGKPLGTLSLVPREKALHVDWVGLHGAAAGEQAGVAGAKHIRSLLPQIAAAYPQHEILMGRRAGGAHRGELRGVELAPHRLARTGMIDSTNHRKRVELAKKVLSEAGFGRAVVKAALAHYGREQQPGVLAAIERATNPQHAVYTAAWIGMLTQQPRVSVFHPGDGQDALHVITSPHPTEHVSEYLRRAGVPRFSSERTATGTRAFVLDPDGQLNPAAWSAGLDGQHTTLRGKAHTLEGRESYQKAIREAEEATNASNSGAE